MPEALSRRRRVVGRSLVEGRAINRLANGTPVGRLAVDGDRH